MYIVSKTQSNTFLKDKIIWEPIRIENLKVAQNDFPTQMIWNDAVKTCTDLLNDWRFPTDDELNLMNLNKDKIGGFANYPHWSSNKSVFDNAWVQDFEDGNQFDDNMEYRLFSVRAVLFN